MKKNFCVTTPIYYIDGFEVHFSTGTDEHGIKVARSAEKAGIEVQKFSDIVSKKFRDVADLVNISYDDFIRTTEERHIKSARTMWELMEKDIYMDCYSGWDSARDEEYVPKEDVVDGKAPSGAPVEWMEEESYFFRLSNYQDKLLKFYDENPDFISPISRRNEIISFVKSGLKDLSISRSQFNWGIPVPKSENHVMYVWIDALANYISSLGFPDNPQRVSEMMAECIHVVGKEILRFHAVYWPAFLMSAGLTLPKKIFAHGWWTSEGQKMSKSLGNVVDPIEVVKKYGLDQVRYFLFREVTFGEDGDFSEEALKKRISYDLANDLGNLVQRVLAFIQKLGGKLTVNYNFSEEENSLMQDSKDLLNKIRPLIDNQNFSGALTTIWNLISKTNKFVNDVRPWELAKDESKREKLNAILTVLCESIRSIAFGIAPFMPDTAAKVFSFINVKGKSFDELKSQFTDQSFPEPIMLFPKDK